MTKQEGVFGYAQEIDSRSTCRQSRVALASIKTVGIGLILAIGLFELFTALFALYLKVLMSLSMPLGLIEGLPVVNSLITWPCDKAYSLMVLGIGLLFQGLFIALYISILEEKSRL